MRSPTIRQLVDTHGAMAVFQGLSAYFRLEDPWNEEVSLAMDAADRARMYVRGHGDITVGNAYAQRLIANRAHYLRRLQWGKHNPLLMLTRPALSSY